MATVTDALNFLLENANSFSKWCSTEALEVLENIGATPPDIDFGLIAVAEYVNLKQAIDKLKNDISKDDSQKTRKTRKEWLANLRTSYEHIQLALGIILNFSNFEMEEDGVPIADYIKLNRNTVLRVRSEYQSAYSSALPTYRIDGCTFEQRIFSLKILLFCSKMLHSNWQTLWSREIDGYLNTVENTLKKASGKEYESILELLIYVKSVISANGDCPKIGNFIQENFRKNPLFIKRHLLQKPNNAQVLALKLCQVEKCEKPLHIAARLEDLEFLKKSIRTQLKSDKTVDVTNFFGETPLHVAAQNDLEENLILLLKSGASFMHSSHSGFTALHFASQNCADGKCVFLLTKMGANLNAKDEDGDAPLYVAAMFGKFENLKILIERGAEVNDENYLKLTALHAAADKGHTVCVGYLLQNGAKMNGMSAFGMTPLYFAAVNGHLGAIERLVAAGADVNCGYGLNYPLFAAAQYGYVECLECLIRSGAKFVQTISDNGEHGERLEFSVMQATVTFGQLKILQKLAEFKTEFASVVNSSTENGPTPLTQSIFLGNNLEFVEFLLENNADPNVGTKDRRRTALLLAVQKNKPDYVATLLKHGAEPNAVDQDGLSAAMIAAATGSRQCLAAVLQAGCDPNLKTNEDNLTALHMACMKSHDDCVDLLLNSGALPNEITHDENYKKITPLDLCLKIDELDDRKSACIALVRNAGGVTADDLP